MTKKKYTPEYISEFPARCVRFFRNYRSDYSSDNAAYRAIASKLGCSHDDLRMWCLEATHDTRNQPSLCSEKNTRLGGADENKSKSLSIIFVVDPPALVIDSILLLASIRKHMPDAHIVPYCPKAKAEDLPPQLQDFFAYHGAPIQLMDVEGVFKQPYKQGNKLVAAAEPRDTSATLFLDSDTMVLKTFRFEEIIKAGHLSVAPEGRFTWGKEPEMWPSAYETFGMELPEERIRLAKSNALSLPYFNAGVVAFLNRTPSDGDFGEIWLETAQRIDDNQQIRGRRPWLDQIALPIAMRRAGLMSNILPKEWNLSLTHLPVKDGLPDYKKRRFQVIIDRLNDADPIIAHYHNHDTLTKLRYGNVADALIAEFTVYDRVRDLRQAMVGDGPTKKDVLREFHMLRAIPNKTPEQVERFKQVDNMKRAAQAGKLNKKLYANWPDSILA